MSLGFYSLGWDYGLWNGHVPQLGVHYVSLLFYSSSLHSPPSIPSLFIITEYLLSCILGIMLSEKN